METKNKGYSNKKLDMDVLREFLDEKVLQYDRPWFIEEDPVSVPHGFVRKEDIEVAGFFAATLAWGKRCTILKNVGELMQLMDDNPFEFIISAGAKEYRKFSDFKHRTFNGADCVFFLKSLKNIYLRHGGLEEVFCSGFASSGNIMEAISYFRKVFFSISYPEHALKHIADPAMNASAKRLNMFLRWMVREDNNGVDFGIWKRIPVPALMCPMDVHTGKVARVLGLLERRQNDRKAVEELTANLRLLDPKDPVKYDFALFGLGIYENFATEA